MSVMLERWNDEKMDGLGAQVDGLEATASGLVIKVDGLGDQLQHQRGELREFRKELGEQRKEFRTELREQREEIGEQRKEIVALRREMNAGFERLGTDMREQQSETSARLEAIQRNTFIGIAVITGAYMSGFAALIGLIAVVM